MMNGFTHVPVLLEEALDALGVHADGNYLDGTYGRGGHAARILERLGPDGRLLLVDRDPAAIADAQRRFGDEPRVHIRHANFADAAAWELADDGLDGVLLDLGVSSPQLDEAERGFSFRVEGPLDMRMDPESGESAAEWVARADEQEIADVLWRHGEERLSRRIARAIVAEREDKPLVTTSDLAALVARTIGYRERNKHPATRTFQALRIHLNEELSALPAGLQAAVDHLRPGGRLVVISFHSLEDRIVKRFIRSREGRVAGGRGVPLPETSPGDLVAVGKAIFAGDAELARNPRARSAVLRVAERRS